MAIPAFQTLRDYWLFFAGESERGRSPLYAQLSREIAEDEGLQALAARATPRQPPANLLFGAVHYLLLGGVQHPLRAWYPHLSLQPEPAENPFPVFKDFCKTFEAELLPVISTRVTNTNEVRRSAMLYPGFTFLARLSKQKLHLVEIGPSAGLNLCFDRYAYGYSFPGSAETACGDLTSPLTLPCEARGAVRPPLDPHPPAIASRVGLELNPVDLSREEDVRWLKALIWPGPVDRMTRIEAALSIVAADPPRILAGDAVGLLPSVLAGLPGEGAVVVFHSHVTYQFPAEARARLRAILAEASASRVIFRLSIEWEGENYPLKLERWENGHCEEGLLAMTDPHGSHLTWIGEWPHKGEASQISENK
ncbi:MAG: DUF2332 domain-containing protein [Alphaproteobacteria bacterium]|nr:DUF2332 domain-containing protein [Alphaproteobacteria bacterium]